MNAGSRRGPTLRKHKRSGRGYAKFNSRQVWFGPYDDRETHAEFAAFKARWEVNARTLPEDDQLRPWTVEELCDGYLTHLKRKHDQRWLDSNLTRVELALQQVRDLFGTDAANSSR